VDTAPGGVTIVGHATEEIWDTDAARRYDTPGTGMFAPEVLGPTVDRLAELAGDGRALEFAIGTGRVAVPLSERGMPVTQSSRRANRRWSSRPSPATSAWTPRPAAPAGDFASLPVRHQRAGARVPQPAPLRLAGRTGPHGPTGRLRTGDQARRLDRRRGCGIDREESAPGSSGVVVLSPIQRLTGVVVARGWG